MSECQANQILDHLLKGGDITPLEALDKFGCFRLGARIWDLKRRGYNIETQWETGDGKRWAKYRMAPGSQLQLV